MNKKAAIATIAFLPWPVIIGWVILYNVIPVPQSIASTVGWTYAAVVAVVMFTTIRGMLDPNRDRWTEPVEWRKANRIAAAIGIVVLTLPWTGLVVGQLSHWAVDIKHAKTFIYALTSLAIVPVFLVAFHVVNALTGAKKEQVR